MSKTDDKKNWEFNSDGYINVLNKYGTSRDNSTRYDYVPDKAVFDDTLTTHYEYNGLFSKIIDAPAEEALKHGFELGIKNPDAEQLLNDTLDALDWFEKATTAIKWSRLYGGALIVMIIDDGRRIDEPLNYKAIRGIDELKVYERAIVQPDYTAMLYGEPVYYQVSSIYGYFVVHASRCLVFKNGILPERTANPQYRFWGIPEYMRVSKYMQECAVAHGHGVKMLERSVQAVYSMKGLAQLLMEEGGDNTVLQRLGVIDLARGILNTVAIDNDGESYEFKTIPFSGVKDVIDTTCNMLSAVTNIPQTVLFGRSPAGQNSTGESDLENYYNLIERIQRLMLRGNLKQLSDIIFHALLYKGKINEKPQYKIEFKPLWSMSETEQAQVDKTKADTAKVKADTANIYVAMGAYDPSEVRRGLAKQEEFVIEELLDDMDEEEIANSFVNNVNNQQNSLTLNDKYDKIGKKVN